ncbi:MAG TPA: LysM peptidoglycan-binding domain-containing protein [Candidatus Hydrogenedentes bacterium]|nr:LysM peptidoglycan-binding domain-containing protein [Candidatus Hydrogenedentota bacterium]HOL76127.1 LysM peptidoglycan-binding domain-containing protein [Candidatus Hydrogenedentota bacterium]HPO84741.1 LysM peptidoglycan-binding domain-containing protein [Candidatus Hydrogenedentota bacterium]
MWNKQKIVEFMTLVAMVSWLCVASSVLAAPAKSAKTSKKPSDDPVYNMPHDMPWELRERYTIETGKAKFVYAADSGEWTLDVQGIGRVVESAGAEVELGDGTKLQSMQIGIAKGNIKKLSDPMGDGIDYVIDFPAHQGLALRHSLSMFNTRPFFLIRMQATNVGASPIEIRAIRPASFYVQNLSPSTTAGVRMLQVQGPYFVPSSSNFPSRIVLRDAEHDFTLAVGSLPKQVASTKAYLLTEPGRWHVEVSSDFDPVIRLNPGETVECDPVWIALSTPRPADIDLYYSWTQSQAPRPRCTDKLPRNWSTIPDGGSMAELCRAAQAWSGAGVRHVLVPKTWESSPGSLVGGNGGFPKDMGKAAAALKSMNLTPGLTLNVFSIQGGDPAWYVQGADGRKWLDLSKTEARNFAAEKLRQTAGSWGFGFVVVADSGLPDDVLRAANLTRTRAQALAFTTVEDALPDIPVLPSSAISLKADLNAWLAVSGATSRLREYDVGVGPVRFDVSGVSSLSPELLTAMMLYGGPIECVGECRDSIARSLLPVMTSSRVVGRPLDAADQPTVWHATFSATQGQQEAMIVFGSVTSPPDPTTWGLEKSVATWRADSGQLLQSTAKRVSPAFAKRPVGESEVLAQLASDSNAPPVVSQPSASEAPAAAASSPEQAGNVAQAVNAEALPPAVPAAVLPPSPPEQTKEEIYSVVAGDTLSRIASRYKVTVADLRTWNNLNGDKILVGQKLKVLLPAPPSVAPVAPPPAPVAEQAQPTAAPALAVEQVKPETPSPTSVAASDADKSNVEQPKRSPVKKLTNWFKKVF